jgi:hypothetical protein
MSATEPSDLIRDDPQASFIGVLQRIEANATSEDINIRDIVDQLDERAFGILILLLAIPCLVPGLPGAQIIAIPIFLLSVQMVIGRSEPWLPGWFLRQSVKRSWIAAMAGFADKRLRWTEALARPRLTFLASGLAERLAALLMAIASVTIMLPITNTIPSLGLTLIAVGLIQRDGLFVLAGAAVAAAWVTLLTVLIAGLIMGAGFAVDLVAERAPWLLNLFGG